MAGQDEHAYSHHPQPPHSAKFNSRRDNPTAGAANVGNQRRANRAEVAWQQRSWPVRSGLRG